ncbi:MULTISPECIES: hypothetical protein, partial [unclassified Fusobacterium]|uniref:hypothetical protein n=1 Tax=unclassified Fusobacterium TaxID=2648384 RepID=UPI001B8B9B69
KYPLIKCVMEYIQQTRSGDINFVTQKTIAEILSLSEKTIRNMTRKGILTKTTDNKYDLKENIKKYLSVKDESNKKKAVEREIQEVKLQVLKNKYHADEDVVYILTDMIINFKSKLQATVTKIDSKIDDIPKAERLNFLKTTIINTLDELAEYNPPDNNQD